MTWVFCIVLVIVAGVGSYLIYNQLYHLRPEREKKIAAGIPATETIILGLIAKASRPVGQTPLIRQLQGISDPEKALQAMLQDLRDKGCLRQTDKTHYCCTGRGRRIAQLLSIRQQRTSR
jgi:hypothetical protein